MPNSYLYIVMNRVCYKQVVILFAFLSQGFLNCHSQTGTKPIQNIGSNISDMAKAASAFLQTLSEKQKAQIQFGFNEEERYNWHYIPRSRKGLTLNEMDDQQIKAAFALLRTVLSDTGFKKANSIIQLENVLREVENRPANDTHTVIRAIILFQFLEPRPEMQYGGGDWKVITCLLIFLQKIICLFREHPAFLAPILLLYYLVLKKESIF